MASYVTANGERRTTVSVRLSDEDVEALDELVHAVLQKRLAECRSNWAETVVRRRGVSRSDALREAIALALSRMA